MGPDKVRLTAAGKEKSEVKKRVEMINQMLDQLTAAQLSQTAPGQDRQQGKDGVEFNDLLQQKRQEAERPAQGQDKRGVQEEAPKPEAEKPQAAQQGQQDETPEDAVAVLAAMMLQPQQQAETPQVQIAQDAAPVVEAAGTPIEAVPQEPVVIQAAPQAAAEAVQPQLQAQDTGPVPQAAAEQAAPQQVAAQEVQTPAQPQAEAPIEQAAPETVVQAAPQEGKAEGQAAEADVAAADAGQAQEGETAEEVPVEAPVFQQEMDAAPVKVAEPVLNPENPVHIEGEEAPQGIVDAMRQLDAGQEESIGIIQIEPENLGPVTMRLTRDGDGVIHMVLEALNPKTAELLDKHAANIQNIAAENTHQEVRVEIKNEQAQPFPENWKDGQNQHGQQQQQQRQGQQREDREASMEDFMHRLRLGIADTFS